MPITLISPDESKSLFPFFKAPAACGFPSPAADYLEQKLSLDQLLIQHPAATFFALAQGSSMQDVGIFDKDILIVDRSLKPSNGDVVMCLLDGELCVKTLYRRGHSVELQSANPAYTPIILDDGQTLDVWGVVIHVVHSLR
ncbi:translesion error-prone DNA polymerase V autoproteolytic subunit [Parendozoicomonas sp. Alg238-R29]|uniref:LexA family protein n=1 Tax=Parendozoicomonas sp. Alg238-R29 TaxID=2993446 RepID=UPI00248D528E|nr:translesion error-prone DNA polymerase V autoproteolytic subunit [Parendozoicomonas sp. Alg238-R29]